MTYNRHKHLILMLLSWLHFAVGWSWVISCLAFRLLWAFSATKQLNLYFLSAAAAHAKFMITWFSLSHVSLDRNYFCKGALRLFLVFKVLFWDKNMVDQERDVSSWFCWSFFHHIHEHLKLTPLHSRLRQHRLPLHTGTTSQYQPFVRPVMSSVWETDVPPCHSRNEISFSAHVSFAHLIVQL